MNTLHVIGAILILSMTALNMQRHQLETRQSQIRSEVEMRATGQATQLLDRLSTLEFDANMHLGEAEYLTPAADFGGAASFASATTVDQVHGLSFSSTSESTGSPLDFDVAVSVRYVRPSEGGFVPSDTPTYFKEVTLELSSVLNTTVTVNRIYTPA
jgi:hypothetical protein